MHLDAAFVEFGYAKDWTAETRRWFKGRLGAFIRWTDEQGIEEIEDVTAPLVRRFIEYRRAATNRIGQRISSQTLHGDVRAIRDFLTHSAHMSQQDGHDDSILAAAVVPVRGRQARAECPPGRHHQPLRATAFPAPLESAVGLRGFHPRHGRGQVG